MADERILIVEDEGIEALDLQHRLIGLGYPAPDIAFSAEEAVQKAGHSAAGPPPGRLIRSGRPGSGRR